MKHTHGQKNSILKRLCTLLPMIALFVGLTIAPLATVALPNENATAISKRNVAAERLEQQAKAAPQLSAKGKKAGPFLGTISGKIASKASVAINVKKAPGNGKKAPGPVVKNKTGLVTNGILKGFGANKCTNLMIVAHPDDEILWGGAHLLHGNWFVVCLTDGYNITRADEFRAALKATGNRGIILNYVDVKDGVINNWDGVRAGMEKDLARIIKFKKWDRIVTHNPAGEYGHKHHRYTSQMTTKVAKAQGKYGKLYYFGKFYQKGKIPKKLKRISAIDLKRKNNALSVYKSQMHKIDAKWRQMVPYENFIKASAWDKVIDGSKTVTVKAKTKGTPAAGYEVTGVRVSVKNVTLKGRLSKLKLIKGKNLTLPAINVTGKKATFKKTLSVASALPKGAKDLHKSRTKVTVTVTIKPCPTKQMDVPKDRIEIVGLGENMVIEESDTLPVVIAAPKAGLAKYKAADVIGTLDVTGLSAGTHTVVLKLSKESPVKGLVKVTVTILEVTELPPMEDYEDPTYDNPAVGDGVNSAGEGAGADNTNTEGAAAGGADAGGNNIENAGAAGSDAGGNGTTNAGTPGSENEGANAGSSEEI